MSSRCSPNIVILSVAALQAERRISAPSLSRYCTLPNSLRQNRAINDLENEFQFQLQGYAGAAEASIRCVTNARDRHHMADLCIESLFRTGKSRG
jgi:hypothetical protein